MADDETELNVDSSSSSCDNIVAQREKIASYSGQSPIYTTGEKPYKTCFSKKPSHKDAIESFNDLPVGIFRRILNQLPGWDLLSSRFVCKYWNHQITNYSDFPLRTFLLVTNDRAKCTQTVYKNLLRCEPGVRHIRFQRIHSPRILQMLPNSLATYLRTLELIHCKTFTWDSFLKLLVFCPSLEELIVRKCTFKWPYDESEWKFRFSEYLQREEMDQFPNLKALEFRAKDPHDVLYMLKFVEHYSTMLEKLSFCCRSVAGSKLDSGQDDLDEVYETTEDLFSILVELVCKHQGTLEIFHAYLLDPIGGAKDANTLMERYGKEVIEKIPWETLHLRSFCLYGGEINFTAEESGLILGNFLRTQTKLKKVILPRILYHNGAHLSQLLLSIPSTVTCVRMPTFDGRIVNLLAKNFPRLNEYYIEAHDSVDLQSIIPEALVLPEVSKLTFYNCSQWALQTIKVPSIVHCFPKLTELLVRDDSSHQCTRLGDSDIQCICSNLPMLRKLHLTNVECVTDFGFTGVSEKDCKAVNDCNGFNAVPGTKIGYSLDGLMNLEYLCLFNIGSRVTSSSFYLGLTFQKLRYLALEGCPKATPAAVQFFVQSNPTLKRWTVQFHDDAVDEMVLHILRHDSPISVVPHVDSKANEPRQCSSSNRSS